MSDKVFKTPHSVRSNKLQTPIRNNSDSDESLASGSDNGSNDSNLSIIAEYDELSRFCKTLKSEYTYLEKSYMDFVVVIVRPLFERFQKSREECLKLQEKADTMARDLSDLESKLAIARRLLDKEKKNAKIEKKARIDLEHQLDSLRDLMHKNPSTLKGIPENTLSRFAFMETDKIDEEQAPHLSCIPEVNSTGSLLSDLSYSRSEDDFDTSKMQVGKGWKKLRPSLDAAPEQPAMKKRRSTGNKVVEISSTDTVRATTTLSVPKNGPITATSIIEALPSAPSAHLLPNYAPSAPPETPQSIKSTESNLNYQQEATIPSEMIFQSWSKKEGPPKPSRSKHMKVESVQEFDNIRNSNNNNGYTQKSHAFQKKTVVLPENCGMCQKKMKFGRLAWKCKDCKNYCHEECKDKLPLPCVPVIHTPNQGNGLGVISDYTGTTPPMVPALIIHCVNEIDLRDSREVGLYRVPGSEKDVKTLKDRFLRGKAAPCLKDVDVHVLCGVVKDFLRSLQEPLITRAFWKDFVSASEDNNIQMIKEKISELPQSNRDTLAYMILHLQRIAEKKEIKMPVENLAIVFGPTIVGYLTEDFDDKRARNNFFSEAKQQIKVMQFLLSLPSSFWESYVQVNPTCGNLRLQQTPSTDSLLLRSGKTPNRYQGITPKRRFFPTPPGNRG